MRDRRCLARSSRTASRSRFCVFVSHTTKVLSQGSVLRSDFRFSGTCYRVSPRAGSIVVCSAIPPCVHGVCRLPVRGLRTSGLRRERYTQSLLPLLLNCSKTAVLRLTFYIPYHSLLFFTSHMPQHSYAVTRNLWPMHGALPRPLFMRAA